VLLPINISEQFYGQTVEGEWLELKTGGNPETVWHTVCTYSNYVNIAHLIYQSTKAPDTICEIF
jgi:hypothetical protein